MSNAPVVGSAFVEVHARASAELEREISTSVNSAASKAGSGQAATKGSVAEARQQLALHKRDLDNFNLSVDAMTPEKFAEFSKLSEDAAGWQSILGERTKIAGAALGETGTAGAGAMAGISGAATVAIPIILGIAAAAQQAVKAFLDMGKAGGLTGDEQADYEALNGALGELSTQSQELAATVGAALAPALIEAAHAANEFLGFLNDHKEVVKDVVGAAVSVIAPAAGIVSAWHDWRDSGEELDRVIDGVTDSVTLLTLAQAKNKAETDRARESQSAAADEFDRRIAATVSALEAELAMSTAAERVTDAQRNLFFVQAEVNDVMGRSERQAQKVADAYDAIRQAQQALADANQTVIESDRKVAEARRALESARFRKGTGSQDALDAADALQSAEFDAARAREEAGDKADDVKAREKDLAATRAANALEQLVLNQRLADAQRTLDDAVRASAQVQADYEIAQREAAGETVSAKDKLELYRQKLAEIADTGGPAIRAEIDRIAASLAALPSVKNIEIVLNTANALKDLSQFAANVPDAVGLALTDIATGAPLAGTNSSARAAATDAAGATPSVQFVQNFNNQADPQAVAADTAWLLQETGAPLGKPVPR